LTSTSTAVRVIHTVASVEEDDGGPSRSVPAICCALAQRGVHVSLVTQRFGSRITTAQLPSSGTFSTVYSHGWRSKRLRFAYSTGFRAKLKSEYERFRPAIIHDHGVWLPSNVAAATMARFAHIPLVVSPRGMLEGWSLTHHATRKRIAWHLYQRKALSGATAFCATSRAEAEQIRKLGFTQPIAVIPNGVVVPELRKDGPERQGKSRALFLSRIHPKKGLPDLLQAWARIRPKGWELCIVGPDENGHLAQVVALVARLGLQDCVCFPGPASDTEKWNLYADSDLFVLPTHSENFGIVVAEALAAGVPVITTKSAPWGALLERDCGWWTDVGVNAIEAALREATASPREILRAMGRRGREYVAQALSWESAASQMSKFYGWIISGQKDVLPRGFNTLDSLENNLALTNRPAALIQ
jgi:glycosyltransferase involved in cell wall biosynthesis